MSGRMLLAAAIAALGALITVVNLRGGLEFSFPLLLGLLLLADAVIRFIMLAEDAPAPADRHDTPSTVAPVAPTDRLPAGDPIAAPAGLGPAAPRADQLPAGTAGRAEAPQDTPASPVYSGEDLRRPAPEVRADPRDQDA